MAKRRDSHEHEELDPMFYIPEGLDGYEYIDNQPDGEEDFTDFSDMDDDGELADALDAPGTLVVIENVFRTLPDGSQIVDLVVEVEDVPGAVNYEFRTVKV